MNCEYKDCPNQAESTIWTEDTGPDDPVCVVCSYHADQIRNAPIQALAIQSHMHRTVWLASPSFPGNPGSVN